MTIDISAVLGLLVNITVLIGAVAAGVVWLRKWLRKQVSEPITRVEKQVKPNGGVQDTSRHLIEEIHTEVTALHQTSAANRGLAEKGLAVAEQALSVASEALATSKNTSERLDRHLETSGKEG